MWGCERNCLAQGRNARTSVEVDEGRETFVDSRCDHRRDAIGRSRCVFCRRITPVAIGAVEGFATAAVVTFVWKARPETIHEAPTGERPRPRSVRHVLVALALRYSKRAKDTVGASHLAARPPYRLSEGEKRAVAIASVLSMAPAIMVMDEPSSNLDQRARRALINLLRTFEHTKVIATHDLDLAADLCERAIVLDEGRVTADDSVANVFRNRDLLSRCHLEMPFGMQRCPVCSGGLSDGVDRRLDLE